MSKSTVEARLSAKDDGLSKALEHVVEILDNLNATVSKIGKIMLDAQDKASGKIKKTQEAVESVPEEKQTVLEAENNVTPAADQAADSIDSVPEESMSALEADNHVTPAANQAEDSIDSIPEESMSALEAANHVTPAANQAVDSLDSIPPDIHVALEASDNITPACEDALDAMREVEDQAEKTGGALKSGFAQGLGQSAFNAAASGLKSISAGVADVGKSFEHSMSNVEALMGEDKLKSVFESPAEGLEVLSRAAQEAGATTQFSASEAADALGYMALAGWDAQKSANALPAILDLAASSGMGLAEASDTVTDYLSAFSNSLDGAGRSALTASEMVDIMAYAQANSNTSAAQLGEAWKNCAANLNAAGQDVQTTTSFLEAMANQGLKGSEAGTAMAAIMRDVTASMENGAIKIGDVSVAVQDEKGNFKDLTAIMADVEKATQGMGDAQKAAALASTFTADSQKGINLLLNEGMGKIAGYEDALRSCNGAASDMAATMNDNLEGDLKSLNSAWEAVQVTLFQAVAPALRAVTQAATKVCQIVNDLISGWQSWQAHLDGTATKEQENQLQGLSGTMKAVYQTVDNLKAAWEAFKKGLEESGALDAVKSALDTLRGAFFLLTSQMGDGSGMKSFGEAVGAVVKWIAKAVESFARFEAKTGGLISKLMLGIGSVKLFGGAFSKVGSLIGGLKIKNPFAKLPDQAGRSMTESKSKIAQIISSIGDVIQKAASGIGAAFKGIGEGIGAMNISGAVGFAVAVGAVTAALIALAACKDLIIPFLDGLADVISKLVDGVLSAFAGFIVKLAGVFPVLADALAKLSPLVEAFGTAFAAVLTAVNPVLQTLSTLITNIVTIVSNAIVAIVEALAPYIPEITQMITVVCTTIDSLVTTVSNAIVAIIEAVAPFIPNIQQIVATVGQCIMAICNVFNTLITNIPPVLEAVRGIIDTVFTGIETVITTVGDSISQVLDSLGDTFTKCGDAIRTAFDGVADIITAFGDAVRNVLDGISGIIDSIGNACLNAGTGFKRLAEGLQIIADLNGWDLAGTLAAIAVPIGAIVASTAEIGESGSQLMTLSLALKAMCEMAGGLDSAGAAIQSFAENTSSLISHAGELEQISLAMMMLGQASIEAGTGLLAAGIALGTITQSVTILAAVIDQANSGVQTLFSAIGSAGSSAERFGQSLLSASAALISFGQSAGAVSASSRRLSSAFRSAMSAVAQAVSAGMIRVNSVMVQGMNTMVASATQSLNRLVRAAAEVMNSFCAAIQSGMSRAVGIAASMAAAIPSAASAAVYGMYQVGVNIGRGLADGMQSQLARVQKVAEQLGKTAEEATRKAAEVHSPSRVFKKIGAYMGEGLAQGMESRFGRIASAADVMSSMAAQNALSNGVEGIGFATDLSSDRRAGDVVIEMNQSIDGRQFAKATARFTRDELDRQDRLKLRLAGGV